MTNTQIRNNLAAIKRLTYTETTGDARQYTTDGRAWAAARKIYAGTSIWWRIVNPYSEVYVIDTFGGYLAK